MADERMSGDYRAVKCETCGVPWCEHTETCSRHAYRPECRGLGRGGRIECCARAGLFNGSVSGRSPTFTCLAGCPCHD